MYYVRELNNSLSTIFKSVTMNVIMKRYPVGILNEIELFIKDKFGVLNQLEIFEVLRNSVEPDYAVDYAVGLGFEVEHKHIEGCCPKCGGADVSYNTLVPEDSSVYYEVFCNSCDTDFREYHLLIFDGNVVKP